MKTLHCDICRKELVNPVADKNYWHYREYDICEDCKDTINAKLRPVLRNHFPYSQDWYEHEFISLIQKGISAKRA